MNSQSYNQIKKLGFIPPHMLTGLDEATPLLVAFSGGADSSFLLFAVCEYAKIYGARVVAAHVNHGIRGEEADRDEEFCRRTAKKYGAEFAVLHADVPKIAAERKISVETAAREVRYEFFSSVMRENSIPALCVAHNADDNLETMIFNMARGSGLSGICGIPQTRDVDGGVLVRPILTLSKSDIIDYCSANNIEYVTDSTNLDTDYARNKIRHLVIPEIKKIFPEAERAAARLSDNLRADALCLESMTEWFLSEAREGFSIDAQKLATSPASISSRALMYTFSEFSGGVDIEYPHVRALIELAKKGVPHSSVDLPCASRAHIENGRLIFTHAPLPPKNIVTDVFDIPLCEGRNYIPQINAEIFVGNTQNPKNIYKNSITLYLDSAKIKGTLRVRSRETQDKLRIFGVSKSPKKIACEKKIPQEIRPRLPVICDDEGVCAIPYLGICDARYPGKNVYEGCTVLEFTLL